MPIRYKCRRCGFVLYEFRGVGQNYIGVPTPSEVIKLVGYVCPSCKRVLETPQGNFKEFVNVRLMSQRAYGEMARPLEVRKEKVAGLVAH